MIYTPDSVLKMLSDAPQPEVPWYARWLGFLTTPFKFLGIKGWTVTGDIGTVIGTLVRPPAHSTDGFYTLDIALDSICVANPIFRSAPPLIEAKGKYIRLEIEPFTRAHRICKHNLTFLTAGITVHAGGFVYIDADGPFLEIHPTDIFKVKYPS